MNKAEILSELVELSRSLGRPERELVIMGEGNTSARISEDTFWVKASGTRLHQIKESGFVEVDLQKALAITTAETRTDDEIKALMAASRVDPAATRQPSIETMFHAILYKLTRAKFIGHTHPTAVAAVICSMDAEKMLAGRTTPEEIVYLGPESVFVPYVDPGLPLAHAVEKEVTDFLNKWNDDPKVIFLQNHGVFALGDTPMAVENTMSMTDKAVRILAGTMQFGGPNFMSEEDIQRIHTRPDEDYRRKIANQK
jgi:rhamnose utilization protein RhaD (predicted bifunctional aldolase and dehydrogenase)